MAWLFTPIQTLKLRHVQLTNGRNMITLNSRWHHSQSVVQLYLTDKQIDTRRILKGNFGIDRKVEENILRKEGKKEGREEGNERE